MPRVRASGSQPKVTVTVPLPVHERLSDVAHNLRLPLGAAIEVLLEVASAHPSTFAQCGEVVLTRQLSR